ncbi:serine/threonine protein kinase [Oculatella sp. LEGE 06141]|uniref:serine/threonine protein kinase n=1 Tax=Oculatella sp. LEGE 06141 TaxID=1828648 RepID=UPI0018801AC6|nr:serine/threonine-protein kinase [Oculatella sp. LEGE 06141]MBE9180946.1 serine/threonine protein kinase [Oculatella sp. LEGE 06141]
MAGKTTDARSDQASQSSNGLLQGRYEVQQQLGKTAGRRTLLAIDRHTQQPVVIKLLTFDSDVVWDDLKLFQREAETLKALSHNAIPRYLDFFERDATDDRQFALVQSYANGRSLDAYRQMGRTFSEAEAKQLAAALLNVLIYLHGRQPPVVHRDIKPSNVLLGDRTGHSIGTVYLVDFGSVQTLASRAGSTITIVGTYGYMPPEQFGGYATPKSDLYSLGATLIALLTGHHPADLPQKELHIQFEQAVNLSAAFTAWLKWLTAPNPDDRPSSAEEALTGLKQRSLAQPSASGNRVVISLPYLLWNTVWRSTSMGLITGGTFGGIFGTSVVPLIGTIAGSVAGAAAGLLLGFINGIIIGVVTDAFYTPLVYPHRYRQTVRLISTLFGIGSIFLLREVLMLPPERWFSPANLTLLAIALITGLSGGLTSQHIANWYERTTRKR